MVVCPTANVGKLVASKADQVRDSQPAAGSRGRLGPKAQLSALPMMTWAEQDMSDSRRLVVVVAQADAQRCTVAVCHGLYSTTEPIGAISALTRGSLHATAVAKTAQSSKTRVMGRPGEAQVLPCGCCLSVPVALVFCRRRQSESYACRPLPCHDACTYIYTVHTQFFHRTAAGHARRMQRVDLLRTMEHLCMTAHKHNTRHPHT